MNATIKRMLDEVKADWETMNPNREIKVVPYERIVLKRTIKRQEEILERLARLEEIVESHSYRMNQ